MLGHSNIFRKVVNLGSITLSAGDNNFNHGISNLETVVNMRFLMKYTNGNWYYNWDMYRNLLVTSSKFNFVISSSSDSATFPVAFVIIEYKNQFDKCVIDQAKCYCKNI